VLVTISPVGPAFVIFRVVNPLPAFSTVSCRISPSLSRDFFPRAVALELSFFEAAYA
jgi:hypothetical protein